MNTDFMKGVVVPILTVIDKDEKIDEDGMRTQVDYVIEGGVSGILAFGSNGEFYMVEEDEMERGLKIMVDEAAGRVPVYFGIGAISTKKCCRLAQMAVANGAAAVSVLQPMFLKPTYNELYNHFKTIAESVPETPVLLYNNPGRVGYTMSAKLVEELGPQRAQHCGNEGYQRRHHPDVGVHPPHPRRGLQGLWRQRYPAVRQPMSRCSGRRLHGG